MTSLDSDRSSSSPALRRGDEPLSRPLVLEMCGNSPLFPGPSWRLSWQLKDHQVDHLSRQVAAGELWCSIQSCCPPLASIQCPWLNPEPTSPISASAASILEVIAALARMLVGPAELDSCCPSVQVKLDPACLVLRSNQHELAGRAIRTAGELIRCVHLHREVNMTSAALPSAHQLVTLLMQSVQRCCAHPLTMAQLAEARRRHIPVFLLDPDQRFYQFGSGIHGRWVSSTSNDGDSAMGVMLARNKSKSSEILRQLGLPLPKQLLLPHNISDEQILQSVKHVGFPCVVKPQDAEQGRGATANIDGPKELLAALQEAKKYTNSHILLQSHIDGHDYRLNVVNGRLNFVIKRSAPTITGSGHDTVLALVDQANTIRKRLRLADGISTVINPDDPELTNRLVKAGLSMSSILEAGRTIRLRGNANISTGGLLEELTPDAVHPKIRYQCESIAQTFCMDVCGIDYLTVDIGADPHLCPGAYIEINSMPQNSPKRAGLLLDNLFPAEAVTSIPTVVLMSEWHPDDQPAITIKLNKILTRYPQATIAFPRELWQMFLPYLPGVPAQQIHFFQHPREPLLNRAVKGVVYLTTPELVMERGLPVAAPQAVILLNPLCTLKPAGAWSAFLRDNAGLP